MALIKCPECGKEISDKAAACPNCGYPIASEKQGDNPQLSPVSGARDYAPQEMKAKKPLKKGDKILISIFAAACILIVIGISIAVNNNGDTSPTKNDQKEGSIASKEDETQEATKEPEKINYTAIDVSTLMNALDANAMNASDTYKEKYLEITGKLNVIDSSGKYISLTPADDEYAILGVQCYIKNTEQKNAVSGMAIGDIVTLRGKCTDVGEIMGYTLDIDSIN